MPDAATILIVDDYPDALDVWDLYLRASGFDVLRAEDGESALQTACDHLPDLVVMDLELPGLSGIQVATALRERDATKHIPLIASTGHSLPAKLEEARRAGFDLVLIKPCDPVELVDQIRRHLASPPASRTASPEQ
jgi:two-component system, cell cycle response regulator DivK